MTTLGEVAEASRLAALNGATHLVELHVATKTPTDETRVTRGRLLRYANNQLPDVVIWGERVFVPFHVGPGLAAHAMEGKPAIYVEAFSVPLIMDTDGNTVGFPPAQ